MMLVAELSFQDKRLLMQACQLALACPPASDAYAVGCVIASYTGDIIAEAYSRMLNSKDHAEQTAIALAQKSNNDLAQCTLYSSIQPCALRQSHAHSCQAYIVNAGIKRLLYGMPEPHLFVKHPGDGYLIAQGVTVFSFNDDALNSLVRQANPHIP